VLVDTGTLFAISSATDPDHGRCVETLRALSAPLMTTWPVLTEAVYLLRARPRAVEKLLLQVEQGKLYRVVELGQEFSGWCRQFFGRFEDHEPQLADASLVYVAEREGIETVFTLDRRDFSVYRTSDGRSLRIEP
jgi:hypothetical protein